MVNPASAVMGDPRRIAMWQRLVEVAKGGIGTLHYWGLDDGLPWGATPPIHQHTMPTVAMGLEGTVRIRGHDDLDLGPGDVLVIEPGVWHHHLPHRPGCASFGLGLLAGRCDVLFFDHQEVLWGGVAEQPYRDQLARLMDTAAAPAGGRTAARLDLIDQMLGQVIQDRSTFIDWLHAGVLAMAAHLWNHLHEPISADDIIARSGFGRTSSYELFREFFARTPQQELLHQRLDLAAHLLRRGRSVTEAAARSGFRDRAELTRAFRKHFGHPPTAGR